MHYVIINEQYFPVRDEVLDAVRSDLLDAVRRGGAFLTFGDGAPHQVQMLVTAHTPVRIQRVEQSDRDEVGGIASSSAEPEVPLTDVDWWLEWG